MRRKGRYELTPFSWLLLILAIGCLIFFGCKTGFIKLPGKEAEKVKTVFSTMKDTEKSDSPVATSPATESTKAPVKQNQSSNTINLSLDEWIGWKPIIDANGGLSTQDGSIYDKLGISVNISIINDATQSSNAIISNKLDAAGYTINRVAFLSKKFKDAGVDVVMPYITNFSNGGDGIIAKSNITSINDLKDAKIGVPQFSEAHSLVVWFVNQSDLKEEEKQRIIDGLIFFATPDEAAKAFFAGSVDVAATWEPYLTQAQNMSDAHILFSTASSSSLIMDGILFNKSFAENNSDVVTKFIDGALQANDMYETELDTIKNVMPMFNTASDEDVKSNCAGARLMTYTDNLSMFTGTAKTIYTGMCDVWNSVGENTNKDLVNTLYDDTYIMALESKYSDQPVTKNETIANVTDDNRQSIIDAEALLQKSTTVQFVINTAKFSDSADATQKLDEFIEIAKILDGAIIEIAGNTDPNPKTDPKDEANRMLSLNRAETVKQYFVLNGISPDRIIVVGNGSSKPIVENDTEEHRAMNRRTDVAFKVVE